MDRIPLDTVPNQEFNIVLGEQNCTIHLYQRGRRMFLDLAVDGETLRQGAICVPHTPLLGTSTTFEGNLYFVDLNEEDKAPQYEELDSRYVLLYLTEDEIDE